MTDLVDKIKTHCGTIKDINGREYVEVFIGTGELDEVINMVFDEAIEAIRYINCPLRAGGMMVIVKHDAIHAIDKLKKQLEQSSEN